MHQSGSPFYFVQSGDSLSKIARQLFDLHSPGTISRQAMQLYRANPHLASPDRIYPGQVLYLGQGIDLNDHVVATDLLAMESEFRSMSTHHRPLFLRHFDTIQTLESGNGTPLSAALVSDSAWRHSIPGVVSVAKSTKEVLSFGKKLMDTGIRASDSKFGNLLKVSPQKWDVVHGELVRSVERQVRYVRSKNLLRLIPSGMRAMQADGKVILVNSSGSGLRAFSDQVQRMRKVGESLGPAKKFAGRLTTGLTLGIAGANVAQDWGTPKQGRTLVKETTKVGTGLLLAQGATAAATGVCVFLDFTTGLGGVACHLGVLVSYGVGASWLADSGGEGLARAYESQTAKRIP